MLSTREPGSYEAGSIGCFALAVCTTEGCIPVTISRTGEDGGAPRYPTLGNFAVSDWPLEFY